MSKLTKEQMVNELKGFVTNSTKQVGDLINYTLKVYAENPRNLSLSDLKDTLETVKELAPQNIKQEVLQMENSLKVAKNEDKKDNKVVPLKKKETKTADQGAEEILDIIDEDLDVVEEEPIKEEPKTKKPPVAKKEEEEKKPAVAKKNAEPKKEKDKGEDVIKSISLAASFPDTLDSLIGKLKVRRDIKDIKELHELVDDGQQLVMCVYWPKRHLRQFNYDPIGVQPREIKEFANDLDIVDIMYASENGLICWGVSLYTEVAMGFLPKGFETDEETGMRYMNGAEYQIYELVEETK